MHRAGPAISLWWGLGGFNRDVVVFLMGSVGMLNITLSNDISDLLCRWGWWSLKRVIVMVVFSVSDEYGKVL